MKLLEFPRWLTDPAMWVPCAGGCGDEVLKSGPRFCPGCEPKIPPAPADRSTALRRAGVPERFRVPFEDPDNWPGLPRVDLRAWTGRPWCCVLWGDVGTGKTFLAVELLWRALCRGDSGAWVRAAELPRLVFARDDGLERLQRARVLVIDDLARGTVSGAWPAIASVICERYDDLLPTIVTTNGAPEDLSDDLALADRFAEGYVVRVAGGSRRKSAI